MTSKDEIVAYYNQFARYQETVAFNERHLFLYESLRRLGLSRASRVLELGCGTGIITALLLRTVQQGRILSVDISPDAIELARRRNSGKNVDFIVSGLAELQLPDPSFDFVTLFDVIEHIPLPQHSALFRSISEWMTPSSLLVINIPNPEHTAYLAKHNPKVLQVVDLEVTADLLTRNAYEHGLALDFFKTYDIWLKRDYQIMVFRKRAPFVETPVKRRRGIRSVLRGALSRLIRLGQARMQLGESRE